MCVMTSYCFLVNTGFYIYWYMKTILSDLFWNGSSWPCCYSYHFCFYVPHALYFYCKVFMFSNPPGFFPDQISVSTYCNINYNVCSFFIIKDYDVWFMVRYVSVGLHLLISLCGYLSFMICFYQFWQMLIWEFIAYLYPYSLAYVKVQFSTYSVMYLYVLFFCHCSTCWHNVGCAVALLVT